MYTKKLNEGVNYFKNEQWKNSYDCFFKLYTENINNQDIYPYLAYSSIKINQIEQLNYFLIYPFKNKIITDINYFETNLSLEQWKEIEKVILENNIKVDNLVKLHLFYFTTELDDRLSSLLNFVPNNIDDEFWLNIFIYNIYHTFRQITRFQNRNIPIYNMSYKQVCAHYDKCISIYSNYALTYFIKAYFSTPLPNGYIQLFDPLNKAIVLNPNYIEAYLLRASWYYEEEMFEECILDNQKIISLEVESELLADIYYQLGNCFGYLDKNFDAIISYNKALQLGCSKNIYLNRAIAKIDIMDYKGSLIDLNEALIIEQKNYNILYFRGKAKFFLKDYESAIKDLSIFLEFEPLDYDSYELRAKCYEGINEFEKAAKDFQKFKEIRERFEFLNSEDDED